MGQPTQPVEDWCIYNNPNFPSGKTPRRIKVSFSGLVRGLLVTWPNPRYQFVLEQVTEYLWEYRPPEPTIDDIYPLVYNIVQYSTNTGLTNCYWVQYYYTGFGSGTSWQVFNCTTAQPTWMYGDNQNTDPYEGYAGGNYQAAWFGTADTPDSLPDLATLAGCNPSNKDLYEPITANNDTQLYRIARRADHTSIYCRKEIGT